MNGHPLEKRSGLDKIRFAQGQAKCREAFRNAARRSGRGAVSLVNGADLSFACLYILRPEILELRLSPELNRRNILALRITDHILRPQGAPRTVRLSAKSRDMQSVLRWMLQTGDADGADSGLEQVLDVAACVLLKAYRDQSVLPLVADMIFARGRKGHYIHDLVWAAFQARDPAVLTLFAQRLLSGEAEDARLARELLQIESQDADGAPDPHAAYDAYLRWLAENDPYLYFTDENFQLSGRPRFCRVDLERKYLQKGTPSYDNAPLRLSGENEQKALAAFKALDAEDQSALSDYSRRMHEENPAAWEAWARAPIAEQLEAAKSRTGGSK